MRKHILLISAVMMMAFSLKAVDFQEHFKDKTMRFDYYHTGNATEEHFAFDGIVSDGLWAGSRNALVDELRLGKYFFEIQEPKSGKILYSRGYASIYGEWETTPDAKENWGVYHESIRFPWPNQEVDLVIYKRDNSDNSFEPIWEYHINPQHYRVNPADLSPMYDVSTIVENGDPEKKVDIVVLSEGYTFDDMEKFRKDARRFANTLLEAEPFASRKEDFNIRAVEVPSPNSGLNHPHQDIYKRSALSVGYGAFDSERYALGFNNKKIRNAASAVPYEYTVILMNDSIYGGGGIYNLYITAAADNAFNEYLFVHEFGHHFAALADEYYTSAVSYDINKDVIEPWELNVTAHPDPETIKWKELVTPNTPIPTPWEKEKYDKHSIKTQKKRRELRKAKAPEEKLVKLFNEKRKWDNELLSNMEYSGHVGAFEGARYMAEGMYRSEANCLMFTRYHKFCAACRRAINMVIDQYTE
ncbi:MAG: IgA Peptidase M64 [Bacteroidales bacterium]|nr:IgA Peptidase M64 [Bacteroidales bacterium]